MRECPRIIRFRGSACLTRGFKQAGVNSLLVSLWSVNDKSTAAFMSAFYRNWIDTGDRH
ncbi:CHAT domain-containing protein, partial [uncultured Helicobacter sp.]|uniref:CHAT domain-containing protein n=1 Tax=uncultured Helicobacter sp. TaxID=175537 RepID=UPI00350E4AE3